MSFLLTIEQIDAAVPRIAKGLEQYIWLQNAASNDRSFEDRAFRRRFKHFYRVRRGPEWQSAFYTAMATARKESSSFAAILELLHKSTGRYEASFASKLFATISPSAPVIDSVVLRNLRLRLPSAGTNDRAEKICEVHRTLSQLFEGFLATGAGTYLVKAVDKAYPTANITERNLISCFGKRGSTQRFQRTSSRPPLIRMAVRQRNVPGVFSDLVIHWHMINQDESTLLAGLI